jgi:hypothetical protein
MVHSTTPHIEDQFKIFLLFCRGKDGVRANQGVANNDRGQAKARYVVSARGTCFIDALMPDLVSEDVKAWEKGGETTKKGAACEPV